MQTYYNNVEVPYDKSLKIKPIFLASTGTKAIVISAEMARSNLADASHANIIIAGNYNVFFIEL